MIETLTRILKIHSVHGCTVMIKKYQYLASANVCIQKRDDDCYLRSKVRLIFDVFRDFLFKIWNWKVSGWRVGISFSEWLSHLEYGVLNIAGGQNTQTVQIGKEKGISTIIGVLDGRVLLNSSQTYVKVAKKGVKPSFTHQGEEWVSKPEPYTGGSGTVMVWCAIC